MKYTELEAWQLGVELAVLIYSVTEKFPKSEMYGLSLQLRKASVSVPSNIAEGEGRSSAKDTYQFQCRARGSLFEVETQAIVSARLGFIDAEAAQRVQAQATKVARKLAGLMNHTKSKFSDPPSADRRPPTARGAPDSR